MAHPSADLRRDIGDLTDHALRDLSIIWRDLDTPEKAKPALFDVLPALVDSYGAASGTLAAEWYDERRARISPRKKFTASPAVIRDTGTQALVGWALAQTADQVTFQSLIEGGTQRRIGNFARQTVTDSSIADPAAQGWQRDGSGECDFCSFLIGRGAVYSEASADFASHDHCQCFAVPAFDGAPRPVQAFTPSDRNISDADRARVREYIRTQ